MNTQDLRALFPVVKESKIINMTYSDGTYDTVLGMLELSQKQEVPETSLVSDSSDCSLRG